MKEMEMESKESIEARVQRSAPNAGQHQTGRPLSLTEQGVQELTDEMLDVGGYEQWKKQPRQRETTKVFTVHIIASIIALAIVGVIAVIELNG